VFLRFVFLLVLRFPAWLRLGVRSNAWKDAEILLLCHQLSVLQRRQRGRVRLSWADRAFMAALLAFIPGVRHSRLAGLVAPGTIVRWHRDVVRCRWTEESRCKPGRPRTHRNIARLVVRMAGENEHRGCRRIAGELATPGIRAAPPTVREILKRRGLEPALRRQGPGWDEFLRSQAQAIIALDLFTVDLLDGTKAYALAAIEHTNRRIRVPGATIHPGGDWIIQRTRNLLIDLAIVRSGVHVPRMNAIVERWIGTCRRELLDRTLIWNLPHLRRTLAEYERHYNEHRPHRTLASAAPLTALPAPVTDEACGVVAFQGSRGRVTRRVTLAGGPGVGSLPNSGCPQAPQGITSRFCAMWAWSRSPVSGGASSIDVPTTVIASPSLEKPSRAGPPFRGSPPTRLRAPYRG
jgi:putative transposase